MQVRPPHWRLNAQCPCCGQGNPLLIACSVCGQVASECEEVGTFFPDPFYLQAAKSQICAKCGAIGKEQFGKASDFQIRHAGLDYGQYC